jgi:transcriptional regulator with XRE-family HTH domain
MVEAHPIATHLREARKSAGLTREQVAVGIGKSFSSVVAYETGSVEPPLHVLRELARLYGVSLADLLGEAADAA